MPRGARAAQPLASLPGRQHVFWGYFCPLERRKRGQEAKPQGPQSGTDGRGLAGCPALATLKPVSMCPGWHRAHRDPLLGPPG